MSRDAFSLPATTHSPALLLGTLLVAVPSMLFAALAALVVDDPKPALDSRVLMFLYDHSDDTALDRASALLLGPGLWLGLAIVVASIAALALRGRQTPALFLASAILATFVAERALKLVFERDAINRTRVDSFPSGSAAISLGAVAAAVLLAGRGRRTWVAIVGAALVAVYGVSIVAEGWHYPSDVAAGWSLALALVSGLWLALRRPTLSVR
jgi:membrane-associated phospholipid phosphatase